MTQDRAAAPPSRAGPGEQVSPSALVDRIRGRVTTVSHFVGHLNYGDAVSFDAVNKWRALRALGLAGELYCGVADDHYRKIARPLSEHRPAPNELIPA